MSDNDKNLWMNMGVDDSYLSERDEMVWRDNHPNPTKKETILHETGNAIEMVLLIIAIPLLLLAIF